MSQESEDEIYFDDDDDDYIDDYYSNNDDLIDSDDGSDNNFNEDNTSAIKKRIYELENFDYECMTPELVAERLQKETDTAASYLSLSPSLSCLVLQATKWKMAAVIARSSDPSEKNKLLIESGVMLSPSNKVVRSLPNQSRSMCEVCVEYFSSTSLAALACNHFFCHDCWRSHMEVSITNGMNSGIPCMNSLCTLSCHEDFVRPLLSHSSKCESILKLYEKLQFQRSVTAHYQLRFCPGVDCKAIFFADSPKSRRVCCTFCEIACCFECGNPYHVPTDCETIKKWLLKCADDSETANYISAHTKDCPNCHTCIEKNGGCNHMKCVNCKHDFCWVCLGEWKKHGDAYYECSRYKEDPKVVNENRHAKAREALKKYLFYFHRWENHSQSLRLESQARSKIQKQIEEKVNEKKGTWIDWQYLLKAGELLAQCRSILHYTYPWAYYAECGPKKTLFEYQQAQLEVEIEDLAWKLEHIGNFSRGEVENQMDVCNKRTQTLLARFVED